MIARPYGIIDARSGFHDEDVGLAALWGFGCLLRYGGATCRWPSQWWPGPLNR